jgi:hypothetical protein
MRSDTGMMSIVRTYNPLIKPRKIFLHTYRHQNTKQTAVNMLWLKYGGEVVSLTRWPRLTPQEDFLCSVLLEAHSVAGR